MTKIFTDLFKVSIYYVLLFLLAITTSTTTSVAQGVNGYQLLWEVSGKNLVKPSYLFGSIHVKDSRAFHFSDSVYWAVANADVFAMETHPDSLLCEVLAYTDGSKTVADTLRLTDRQKQQLKDRFSEYDFDKSDSLLLKNPYLLRTLLYPASSKKDGKEMIVDIFLYGLAKTRHKPVLSLESTEQHLEALLTTGGSVADMIDADVEDYEEKINGLIEIYASGNLELLNSQIQHYLKDNTLLKTRNVVMLQRMVQLMPKKSVFAVTGAAHLPGEYGLINLLRREGYNVRQVQGTFDGHTAFDIEHDAMGWQTVSDSLLGFDIQFPAGYVYSREAIYQKTLVHLDMFSEAVFSFNASFVVGESTISDEAFVNETLDSILSKNSNMLISKQIFKEGTITILEATIQERESQKKVKIWLQNNRRYLLIASIKKNSKYQNLVDRVLSSVVIKSTPDNASIPIFKDPLGAFQIKLPPISQRMVNDAPSADNPATESFKIMNTFALDATNSASYLVRYNDYPPGVSLIDKESVYQKTVQQLTAMGNILVEPRDIQRNGYVARNFKAIIGGNWSEIEMFFRGNRFFLLLREHLSSTAPLPENDPFDTFAFLPYQEVDNELFAVGELKLSLPQTPMDLNTSPADRATEFVSTKHHLATIDPKSGTNFQFLAYQFGKYSRYTDVDSMFHKIHRNIKEDGDSVLSYRRLEHPFAQGAVLYSYNKQQHAAMQHQIWSVGDHLYVLYVTGGEEDLKRKNVDDFFRHFESSISTKKTNFDIFASKADLLITDLQNQDTATWKPAWKSLQKFYSFEKNELPLLRKAIRYVYPNDQEENGSRTLLIDELATLGDKPSIPLLKRLYVDRETSDAIRTNILQNILSIDSTEFEWYFNSLLTKPPTTNDAQALISPLLDSLEFTAQHMDRIASLLRHPDYRAATLTWFKKVLELKKQSQVSVKTADMLSLVEAFAKDDLAQFVSTHSADENSVFYNRMFTYLQIFGASTNQAYIQHFADNLSSMEGVNYIKTALLIAMVDARMPLDSTLFKEQLENIRTRYDVMKAFEERNLFEQIPQMYKEGDQFAKMLFNEFLYDDYEYPTEIKEIGKIVESGNTYYVFSVKFEGNELSYLGVSGPFAGGNVPIDFDYYNCVTNYDEVSENWEIQAKNLIQESFD
ncbi:TraB/GumN family protein [Sphingobacterium bambusae]|uniref:TraB/GumN family protein n=1 Tax=Sphingobacterium bambusae TaxID=662858 RepID=A0ABW6BNX2_9SPHI|nr:TraB/GumN family protein [Sphingobacterium bambusae]WPL48119.1 TraB/GumN family protein [Sphingobacterium bambusae]